MIAALAVALMAQAAAPATAQVVAPWTEAVVSVRDLDASSRLLREVGGWRITGRGRVAPAELAYWRLDRMPRVTARFLRICAPQAATGCVRFIRFDGAGGQRPVRLAARAWDTGGIYSIMVRTDDAGALFDRAIALGWWAESEPIGFTFGASRLRNVVLQGPDGLQIAAYERTSPPFDAFPVGTISQGFNAMRMVRDQRVAVAFYRDILGFAPVFDSDYRDPAPTPNNFSLPHNLTTSVVRRAAALQPVAGETGRVEVMQFVGLRGKDLSAYAAAPNLGVLSLRYPVTGLAAYRRSVEARGGVVVQQARHVDVGGIGRADLFAVRDPDGNLTEFYEVAR